MLLKWLWHRTSCAAAAAVADDGRPIAWPQVAGRHGEARVNGDGAQIRGQYLLCNRHQRILSVQLAVLGPT
jgi:hypothetical protein